MADISPDNLTASVPGEGVLADVTPTVKAAADANIFLDVGSSSRKVAVKYCTRILPPNLQAEVFPLI